MDYSAERKSELPFLATSTIFAMLSGFLLVLLLPYDRLLGWFIFITLEVLICVVIMRRLVKIRKRLTPLQV